jgi:hypothetical protein
MHAELGLRLGRCHVDLGEEGFMDGMVVEVILHILKALMSGT